VFARVLSWRQSDRTEPATGEGNMPTIDEVFESKYLKAADFKNGPRVLTIIESQMQTLKALDGSHEEKMRLVLRERAEGFGFEPHEL
jgi:hypothetical protein